MSDIVNQAARRTPPPAGTPVSVTGTSTSATDLSALKGQWIWLQASGTRIHFRFGTSAVGASVVAEDVFMEDGEREEFLVVDGLTHFRAIAATDSGILRYAVVGA